MLVLLHARKLLWTDWNHVLILRNAPSLTSPFSDSSLRASWALCMHSFMTCCFPSNTCAGLVLPLVWCCIRPLGKIENWIFDLVPALVVVSYTSTCPSGCSTRQVFSFPLAPL